MTLSESKVLWEKLSPYPLQNNMCSQKNWKLIQSTDVKKFINRELRKYRSFLSYEDRKDITSSVRIFLFELLERGCFENKTSKLAYIDKAVISQVRKALKKEKLGIMLGHGGKIQNKRFNGEQFKKTYNPKTPINPILVTSAGVYVNCALVYFVLMKKNKIVCSWQGGKDWNRHRKVITRILNQADMIIFDSEFHETCFQTTFPLTNKRTQTVKIGGIDGLTGIEIAYLLAVIGERKGYQIVKDYEEKQELL